MVRCPLHCMTVWGSARHPHRKRRVVHPPPLSHHRSADLLLFVFHLRDYTDAQVDVGVIVSGARGEGNAKRATSRVPATRGRETLSRRQMLRKGNHGTTYPTLCRAPRHRARRGARRVADDVQPGGRDEADDEATTAEGDERPAQAARAWSSREGDIMTRGTPPDRKSRRYGMVAIGAFLALLALVLGIALR